MTAASDSTDYEVIIVGGGPTGLTLLNLLAGYGVRTLLVERNASTVQEPRAVSIDDESLRTMQAVGIIDALKRRIVPGYGSEYLSPAGRSFLKVSPSEAPFGYPKRNAFRQPELEQLLLTHVDCNPKAETLLGWTADEISQSADCVSVRIQAADGRVRLVTCRYLVGADGARSFVRSTLGVELKGRTFEERWLIIDLERSPAPHRDTIVFCDARRPWIALPGPDQTRRFEFKLHPYEQAETMLAEESVTGLLARCGVAQGSVLKRKVVYTFHARVAQLWKAGNILLAGDACHLTPPFAGQGMNSGIRDAHNLAWKLASVVQGVLGPDILRTYEQERRPHVSAMIDLALHMGRIMGPPNRFVGAIIQGAFRLLRAWPRVSQYLVEMRYKPQPRFSSGFLLLDKAGPYKNWIGRLFPQPLIEAQGEAPQLLDEVAGDGFTLIGITDDITRLETVAQMPAFRQLHVRAIGIGRAATRDKTHQASRPPYIWISDAEWSRLIADDTFILLRPDRYVLGMFDQRHASEFESRLAELIASTGPADGIEVPKLSGYAEIPDRIDDQPISNSA